MHGVARAAWLLTLCWSTGCVPLAPDAADASGLEEEPPLTEADWNDAAIHWVTYADGVASSRARELPLLLVFYTDWCPHCHNYSRVFHDPEVVRLAQRFVMVRVERDGNRELSGKFDLDGEYIPRTFFVTPSGEVRTELRGGNPRYHYFLDEHAARELVTLMQRAVTPSQARGAGSGSD